MVIIFITEFSPASCYFAPLRPNITTAPSDITDQVLYPHKATAKLYVDTF